MMTQNDIEFICKQTLSKKKIEMFLNKIASYKEAHKILLWRVIMPYKMYFIFKHKHFKFFYGGRWGAKTYSICKYALLRADQERLRILCTREIQNTLDESLHAELSNLIFLLKYDNYRITENKIFNIKTKSEFLFKGLKDQIKKQTIKSFSNIDICWVEEAQTVSKGSLDILMPTVRKTGSEIIFSYNSFMPDDPVDQFRQSIEDHEKIDVNILCFDNLFNSKETWKDIKRLKRQYEAGENQDYLHTVLGHPISLSEDAVFKVQEIQQAIERSINPEGQIVVGVDLARMGGDKTIFIKRKGLKMIDYKMFNVMDGADVIKEIVSFIDNNVNVKINIDETGIAGGYIRDMLIRKGFKKTYSINFGSRAKDPNKYNNAISEMWFELKSKIADIDLMRVPDLKSQLITREYIYDNKERKCIESKDHYKKRGYKSPDFADALVLCYYENTGNKAAYFDF